MTTTDHLSWRTSTRSSNGENCVEVAPIADGVIIRHSKHPAAGTISFSYLAWKVFVGEALDGPSGANGVATITLIGTDAVVRSLGSGVELTFDAGEWTAFRAGAAAGEFDPAELLATA